MSIATEITRIQQAKADIKTAIEAKGVTVPSSATIDTYDDYVSQISGGGGGGDIPMPSNLSSATFNDYGRITSAAIKSGVTSIGQEAFAGCTSLTSVTLSNTVTSFSYQSFYASGIVTFSILDSVTDIGTNAFQNCGSLTSCTIGSGITSITNNTFAGCSSLKTIDIPNGITSIGGSAFQLCTSLTSVTIGSGVTSIGQQAFNGCRKLTSITIYAATPPTLENANAFNNTNNCPIYVPSESVDTYKAANIWSTHASRIQAIPNS